MNRHRQLDLAMVLLLAGVVAMGVAEGPGVGIATALLVLGGLILWVNR